MAKKKNNTDINPIEMYFEWYLEELKQYGYVEYYDREPELIEVLPPFDHKREKHFKVKENTTEEFNMLQSVTYTYDYRIAWTEKAKYIFTEVYDPSGHFRFGMPTFVSHWIKLHGDYKMVSYIDVKPHISAAQFGGNVSSYYTFPFIQKFLMRTRGLFINKATPINQGKHGVSTCLFAKTFTPNRFLFTDAGQQLRKIRFVKRSISAYTDSQKAIINKILDKESQTSLL